MGTVRKFKRRSGSFPVGMITLLMLGAFGMGGAAALLWTKAEAPVPEGAFSCMTPRTIDGDTFDCAGTRVRLQGIDAPETEGHCRSGRRCAPGDPIASTDNLRRMMRWNKVICQQTDIDRYGRTVARCTADGVDLSCAQVKGISRSCGTPISTAKTARMFSSTAWMQLCAAPSETVSRRGRTEASEALRHVQVRCNDRHQLFGEGVQRRHVAAGRIALQRV